MLWITAAAAGEWEEQVAASLAGAEDRDAWGEVLRAWLATDDEDRRAALFSAGRVLGALPIDRRSDEQVMQAYVAAALESEVYGRVFVAEAARRGGALDAAGRPTLGATERAQAAAAAEISVRDAVWVACTQSHPELAVADARAGAHARDNAQAAWTARVGYGLAEHRVRRPAQRRRSSSMACRCAPD